MSPGALALSVAKSLENPNLQSRRRALRLPLSGGSGYRAPDRAKVDGRALRRVLATSTIRPVGVTGPYLRETSSNQFDGFVLGQPGGVAQRLVKVLDLQVGISCQNGFFCFTRGKQSEEPRNREPEPPNAGLAG